MNIPVQIPFDSEFVPKYPVPFPELTQRYLSLDTLDTPANEMSLVFSFVFKLLLHCTTQLRIAVCM